MAQVMQSLRFERQDCHHTGDKVTDKAESRRREVSLGLEGEASVSW